MTTRDEVQSTITKVKDLYGVYYAKALIEATGVRKMFDMPEASYDEANKIGSQMNEQKYDTKEGRHAALEILVNHIARCVDNWHSKGQDHSIQVVLREWEDAGGDTIGLRREVQTDTTQAVIDQFTEGNQDMRITAAPQGVEGVDYAVLKLPRLNPNDVIGALIEIAFKSQELLATWHAAPNQLAVPHEKFNDLADALAPLNQLPYNVAQGDTDSAALRAKHYLQSFLTGAVTIHIDAKGADVESVREAMAAVTATGMREVRSLDSLMTLAGVNTVRSYDDAYVHSLVDGLADISTDGRRFRTLMWLMEQGRLFDEIDDQEELTPEQITQFAPYTRAGAVMEELKPVTLDQFRTALDAVSLLGVVPDMPSHFYSLAGAYDKLQGQALGLAASVVNNYRVPNAMNSGRGAYRCVHCGNDVPADDTLAERHMPGCAVLVARQMIEDAQ